ncbi:MAG TPA: glycosyltransferase [Methylomirabilota bacterium]|jgi:glycosyltransferase involved in cell wall biosynthesis|nr:glycosyltransferase [Methylomirabilota bacterium]
MTPGSVVLHTESSRGFGGQEIRIIAESRWLSAHGRPALIAAQPGARLLDEAARAGVPTVAITMRAPWDLSAIRALRRVMRAHAIGLVHTHSSIDAWVGGLAARSLGLPVVRSRHVTIPIPRHRGLVYRRLADRVIGSGEAAAAIVRAAGVPAHRVVAIGPGLDTARFHAGVSGAGVRSELGLTGPAVGLVANIRGSKGHDYFLEAARAVRAARPDARFVIVGDGVGFDEVRRRVKDMDLEGAAIMTGFRRDVPEVMAALDVLVLPSIRSEAVSQVIPQALAIGTPVIGTTVGGTPELVRDGETGRLVPPADAPALAAAILDLLRDPARARALARRGQAEVLARHSLDATMARTLEVYEAARAASPRS